MHRREIFGRTLVIYERLNGVTFLGKFLIRSEILNCSRLETVVEIWM